MLNRSNLLSFAFVRCVISLFMIILKKKSLTEWHQATIQLLN